ncbi:odorant receptor 85b-like [Apis cerana]|uniref:odorant receptor 85b-like n=1 Tax=Apis cerana TaxID=7461 RepID=UPI0007E2D6B2|nr:odorant receptor 85b-like [Apis cerana]
MSLKTIITYPIEVCLRLIGIWPYSSYKIVQRVFWIIVMSISTVFQLWYCISYFKTADLPDLLDGITVTLSNTVTFIKLIILWFNYRTLHNILIVVFEDWNNRVLTHKKKQFMIDNTYLCSRISNFLFGIYSMTCILYSISTMLISNDTNNTNNQLILNNKKLLLKMKFPFDFTIFPLYEFIIIAQFVFEYSVAFTAGMLMAFSAALVLHIGSQIDITCQEIIEIPSNKEEISYVLKNIIIKHQRILRLSENVKYLFLYTSLIQFLSNILVICFLGFILVNALGTEKGSTIFIKCFPYYIAANCEAFILCYTGEYLMFKNESIIEAVYNMLWYNLNPQDSRIILLILIQAQRQLTLSAGNFVTLSAETFASMQKVSASYISILMAMY